MPEPLTSLERRILDYVVDYLRRNTYQPSIREIGRRFDIKSTKTVSEYLQSLAGKGWIERDPSRSRGVRLLGIDLTPDAVAVPCYEDALPVAAAARVEPVERLGIDRRLVGSPGACFLVMKGDAMADAGILHGDLLLVEPVRADDLVVGDVVVVHDGGVTRVERFFPVPGAARAAAASPASSADPQGGHGLAGRVTSIFRRLRVAVHAGALVEPVAEGASS